MLIKSFSSKVWLLRSFLSSDRICLKRHMRSINRSSVNFKTNWITSPVNLLGLQTPIGQRYFSFTHKKSDDVSGLPNAQQFDSICNETLESLTEYFEHLVENCSHLAESDVNYSDGVLTVKFGDPHGTYVINRQTPNQQIWLSSPTSGPKRYDFEHGHWIYRHDGISLHQLLDREIGDVVKHDVDFSHCSYSGTQE